MSGSDTISSTPTVVQFNPHGRAVQDLRGKGTIDVAAVLSEFAEAGIASPLLLVSSFPSPVNPMNVDVAEHC